MQQCRLIRVQILQTMMGWVRPSAVHLTLFFNLLWHSKEFHVHFRKCFPSFAWKQYCSATVYSAHRFISLLCLAWTLGSWPCAAGSFLTQTKADGSEAELDWEEEPQDAKADLLLHQRILFPDGLILFLVLDSPSLQISSVMVHKKHHTDLWLSQNQDFYCPITWGI